VADVVTGGVMAFPNRIPRTIVFLRWSGFDEGDQISGNGSAELQDDGSLEIELSFDNGDNAVLAAHRQWTSSTAC
jgi:hypothetical protein